MTVFDINGDFGSEMGFTYEELGWIYGYGQHFHDLANMHDDESPYSVYGIDANLHLEWLFRNESHACELEGIRRGEWHPSTHS